MFTLTVSRTVILLSHEYGFGAVFSSAVILLKTRKARGAP
jgi:hypothetical protein